MTVAFSGFNGHCRLGLEVLLVLHWQEPLADKAVEASWFGRLMKSGIAYMLVKVSIAFSNNPPG